MSLQDESLAVLALRSELLGWFDTEIGAEKRRLEMLESACIYQFNDTKSSQLMAAKVFSKLEDIVEEIDLEEEA